jgi:4-amino-4-deoxy-L-arabinose transferase-like glycosyltransferase
MVAAQSLDLGYGPQPPLYAWLQWAVFAVTGPTLAGLAILKNALLAAALLALWAAGRVVGAGHAASGVAALSMLLIPGFAWEAQRALTHTPLAVATGAASLLVFLMLRHRPTLAAHALLGLMLGLGLLSKANVALPAVGMIGTLLLWPVAPRRHVVLTLAVAVAVVAPTVLWSLSRLSLVTRDVDPLGGGDWLSVRAAGTAALAVAAASLLAIAVPAHAALFLRRALRLGAPPETAAARTDIARVVALTSAALLLTVLVAGATDVKERWLVPVLFPVPLLMALWAERALDAQRLAWFMRLVGVLALTVAIVLPVNWQSGRRRMPHENAPFATLVPQLAGDAATVFAASNWIGGNVRREAPHLAVLTPQMPDLGIDVAQPARLVWPVAAGAEPPSELVALMRQRIGPQARAGAATIVEAPGGWRGRQSLALAVAPVLTAP